MKENDSESDNEKMFLDYPNERKIIEDEYDEEKLDEENNEEDYKEKIENIIKTESGFDTNFSLFDICIIGDVEVGKTSLLNRFCNNAFNDSYNNTIGADLRIANFIYQKYYNIKLQIWDTSGQEKYNLLTMNYINKSHAIIFVYDISNKKSFEDIEKWRNLVLDKTNRKININFLLGNKSDINDKREVLIEDGKKYAEGLKFIFFETSAKDNTNVNEVFKYLTYKLAIKYVENKNEYTDFYENYKKNIYKMDNIDIKEEKRYYGC